MEIDAAKLASQNQMLRHKCQHLQAQRDRLREALERIMRAEPSEHQGAAGDWRDLRFIARQALEREADG